MKLTVYGVPQSKGSTRAFVRNGRPVVTSTNKNLKDWSLLVRSEIQHAHGARPNIKGPVSCILRFYLPRPKSLPKRVAEHTKRPDIDKLARAAIDPLIGHVLNDDAQIVYLSATKLYGDPPRVEMMLEEVEVGDVEPR